MHGFANERAIALRATGLIPEEINRVNTADERATCEHGGDQPEGVCGR
jgi:hypothetical protein